MPDESQTPHVPERQPSAPAAPPKKRKKKKMRRRVSSSTMNFLVILVSFLTVFALLSLAVAAIFLLAFNSVPSHSPLYGLSFKRNGSTKATLAAGQANNTYGLYVPYNLLSRIADVGIVGDGDKISLICLPDRGIIGCRSNSTLITVNGNAVRLSAPVLFTEDDYLLPVELLENYVFGIDVTYNDSARTCVLSRSDSDPAVSLKMSSASELEKTYFPESYKVYE